MKILLISPPFYKIIGFYNRYFPFGITVIGTMLAKRGHQVSIYDADFCDKPEHIDYAILPEKYPGYLASFKQKEQYIWRKVKQTIAAIKPDLIGISSFTTFAASAFHSARISKQLFPSCPVVIGGPHATVKADEILSVVPWIDYVVRGEGELTMRELVDYIEAGSPEPHEIKGLSYRSGSRIMHNPMRPPLRDLDRTPIPDRSLLMNEKKYSSEDMGMIMTSRGCPYGCTYCAATKGVTYRSADNVIKEIRMVKERYHTTQVTFKDDSFTINRKRVEELCDKIIQQNIDIKWECNTRINLIDEELLAKMKKAGCNFIKVGIESGSERILESMNKKITLDQIRKAAETLRRSGIHWTGYFLIGVPGETIEDIHKTIEFMRELDPDTALIGVYEPFPGTVMFEEGIQRNLVKQDMSLEDFFEVLPHNYYKRDPRIQTDTIDPDTFTALEKEVKEAFHKHNVGYKKVFKAGLSKIKVYIRTPALLMDDMKKYWAYRFRT